MSIFTEDLFAKGIKQRVSTVGKDYVKKISRKRTNSRVLFKKQ